MKPVRRTDSASQSCSCTSCLYKSESDQLSIRKYIARGSRISRLYFGKYIPLREQKLLNRLVRTRAVYDDLRARLISDSTLSLEKNADLRPGNRHIKRHIKPLDAEQSGAILELVDIIDKGAALSPKKLSDCCSCCSCSSKIKVFEEAKKEQRRKRGYARTYEEEYGQTRKIGKGEGIYADGYEREYREFGKTLPGRTGERYNKKGVRFKAKRIRSEPCTCTFKFSGMIKKHLKTPKIRAEELESHLGVEETNIEAFKKQNIMKKSYQKYKAIQDKLEQDIKKINKSSENLKQSVQLRAKDSLRQVKNAKNKIKANIQTGVRKSIQALKDLNRRDKAFESWEYPGLETDFKIKKDSIVKFKDYLKRKEMMKDWECDLECEPGSCVPEECFKIIKLRRKHKRDYQTSHRNVAKNELVNRDMNIGETPLSKSNSSIQAEEIMVTTGTREKRPIHQGHNLALKYEMTKQERNRDVLPISKSNSSMHIKQFARITEKDIKKHKLKKKGHKQAATYEIIKREVKLGKIPSQKSNVGIQAEQLKMKTERNIKKQRPILRLDDKKNLVGKHSTFVADGGNKLDRKVAEKSDESFLSLSHEPNALLINKKNERGELGALKKDKPHSRGRQAVRITSSFSFDVEFYKTASNSKTSQSNRPSGIRMQTPKYKRKRAHRRHRGSQIKIKPLTRSSFDTNKNQQARVIQTDKYEGIPLQLQQSRLSNIKTNTDGTKSVSSLTNRSTLITTNKNINTDVAKRGRLSQVSLLPVQVDALKPELINYSPNKQAVRIGSTFSFNVEFYRKTSQNEVITPSIKAKVKQIPTGFSTKSRNMKRKLVKVKGTSARAYNEAKTTIHRCFCTLKLHKKGKTKKNMKTSTTASVTVKTIPSRTQKNVGTKKKYRNTSKVYQLQPYECEPGICIPGACDPVICKKFIALRKDKRITKSVGSYTSSRKTKSTASIISRPITTAKTVQSLTVPMKTRTTNARRRYKQHLNLAHGIRTPARQAVRIGSSFSFNIEFYKNKHTPTSFAIPKKQSPSITPKIIEYKKLIYRDGRKQNNYKPNKSMFTQIIKMDKNIGPSLKRCFCTLKLYKNKPLKTKPMQKTDNVTSNTQTFGEVIIGDTVVNRGTKTKNRLNYKILPFECEPHVCIPGECDPYLCIERIKRRNLITQDNGVFTDRPEMTSASTLAHNLFQQSEGTFIQPRLIPRGTEIKPAYIKPKGTFTRKLEFDEKINSKTEAKQAVRVGSSFKFSIEFSKRLPDAVKLTKLPNKSKSPKLQRHRDKDKGVTVTKLRVNHVNTQGVEPNKNHRATTVRPILKRCFCTLNLIKKPKNLSKGHKEKQRFGPEVYTIGRVMTEVASHYLRCQKNERFKLIGSRKKYISVSSSSFLLKKHNSCSKSRYRSLRFYSMINIPMKTGQPLNINSNITVKIIKQLNVNKDDKLHNIKQTNETSRFDYIESRSSKCIDLLNQPHKTFFNTVTDISRYLDRCFCTMNVQISKPGVPPRLGKVEYKLKPFECEPHICIPGDCDPHECKKWIMKRYARHANKYSGITSTNKSISSNTSYTGSDSKSIQIQRHARNYSQKSTPKKFYMQNYSGSKHRESVRIGSSFSFNLELHKTRSQPFRKYATEDENISHSSRTIHYNPKKTVINKDVQGNRIKAKDGQSQRSSTSADRAIETSMKRCFCTLKLQKKGKIQKEHVKFNTLPTRQPQSISNTSRNAKIGTTAKHPKIPFDLKNLESYECEPGICTPGQCDPYKCLELIKQRKNLGINTTRSEKESISSMTNDSFLTGKYKSREVYTHTKPNKMRYKTTKARKYGRGLDNSSSEILRHNSRQAVRIGSNFSFNIEFFKDSPQIIPNKSTKVSVSKPSNSNIRQTIQKYELKNRVPQNNKKSHRRSVQVYTLNNQVSTEKKMPSIEITDQHNKNSFKNRCFCLLGLKKYNRPEQNNKEKNKAKKNDQKLKIEKPFQNIEKETYTNFRRTILISQLEPYECEPGICIPGECNPYFCDKIIQQRIAKQYSKGSETESAQTKSVSSNLLNKQLKNERTQAQGQMYLKKKTQPNSKTSPHQIKTTKSPNKRLVKIGSNFSFDIEFYKENLDDSEKRREHGQGQYYRSKKDKLKTMEEENKLKNSGTVTPKMPSERSKKSQVKKNHSRTFGVNPLLKRCFCTLKLMNKVRRDANQQKNLYQGDIKRTVITKSVETQSKKQSKVPPLKYESPKTLLPYECEPFVCVPGKCDPEECLKRIKKRQQQTKDFGVVTKNPKNKSKGSVAITKRHENLQAKRSSATPNKDVQRTYYVKEHQLGKSYDQSRKVVRIGSNFSFNIEFFKDVENDTPKEIIHKPLEELKVPKLPKNALQQDIKAQSPRYKHEINTQVSTNKRSTSSGMDSLKRCFCTLQLKNRKVSKDHKRSMKIQLDQPKSDHSSVGTFIKKCVCTLKLNKIGRQQSRPPVPTVQYSLKGTSTDNRRITQDVKKPIRILEPFECEPYVCVPGNCDPHECLKIIQRRQVRDFGTDYKRYLKDSATDSIKQPGTKSTKSQCRQKQKNNSRGTHFVSKHSPHSKETTQYSSQPSHYNNRQVVRIGSNFSFNVEFFKDCGNANIEDIAKLKTKRDSKIKTKSEKLWRPIDRAAKPTASDMTIRRQRCKSSQITCLKKHQMNSAVNTAPRRCFCTLKFLDKSPHSKIAEETNLPNKVTKNKTTTTKVKYAFPHELGVYECPPNMCIPGECNPFECLDKMKKKGIVRKSRHTGTKPGRTSTMSVGNHSLNQKCQESQFQGGKKRNTYSYSPHSEPQSETLKSPRILENVDRRNKHAVRIGSNFNFNVEFFKQKSQPGVICVRKMAKSRQITEDSKPYSSNNVTATARNVRHYNSQMDGAKVKDQASDAGKIPKRCFCTLQLTKHNPQKSSRKNVDNPGINVTYPQTFTVGRVTVEPSIKKKIKTYRLAKANKSRSTCTDAKLFHNTVGTKTNKKYLQNNSSPLSQCNPDDCPDYHTKVLRKHKSDMQTILPYTPSKFNRKESRTLVKYCGNDNIPNNSINFGKGKRRLTAKKSKKSIPTNTKASSNNDSSFYCRCVNFFTRRSETKSKNSGKQEHINKMASLQDDECTSKRIHESEPAQLKLKVIPKNINQRSNKAFVSGDCPNICPINTKSNGKWNSKFVKNEASNKIKKTHINMKEHAGSQNDEKKYLKQSSPPHRVTFADSINNIKTDVLKGERKKSILSKSSMKSRLCYSCTRNDCPLKFTNSKSGNKAISYSESADDCQYCECCKRKIDVDEISKGGGDRRSTISPDNKKDTDTCPCGRVDNVENDNEKKDSISQKSRLDKISHKYSMKIDKISHNFSKKSDKCCNKNKPLFEMLVDSVNYGIINKEEVIKNVDRLGKNNYQTEYANVLRHGPLCRCCKCIEKQEMQGTQEKKKKEGAKISVKAKGPEKASKKLFFARKTVPENLSKPRGPCICGSKKCAAESKRKTGNEKQDKNYKQIKRCLCKSIICKDESKRLRKIKESAANKAKRKAKAIKNAKEMKEVYKRLKIEREKDQIRRQKRMKRNKELEARVKKYKDSSDTMLAIDSLVDIGKLGVSSLGGALRYTAKALYDPKVACEKCKICKKNDPDSIGKALQQLEKDYMESDAAATARRLKMRCLFMKRVQSFRQRLEENPVTHFILHMADKNANTRQFKPKPKRRVREPLDFQCSLYMASLRRRPHLAVYYKCPWFYPHFITMLNIWKQFTDIMLFLLAALVWSPCILCMEGCRAMLCCFFCTG